MFAASSQMVGATWVLVGLYTLVVLYFVIKGAMKTHSMDDYAVGSQSFSPLFVALSLSAAMMSAATFIINPGLVARFGISGWVSFGVVFAVGAIGSLIVITKGFRKHGSQVQATTMAQWIGKRYDSPKMSLFFGFLSLLLITFIVLIVVGLTKVLSKSLNLSELYVLLGVVFIVFGYMMFGGANSMIYTNAIQASIMIVVSFVLLGSGYEHFSGGVHGFLEKLAAIDPNLATLTNPKSYFFRDLFEIFFCQFIVGVAVVCQPHIITRSLMLKSEQDVNKYLTYSTVVLILFFNVVFVGLFARLAYPSLMINGVPLKVDGVVSAYVVGQFPVYVGLILVLGLIAAGISTLEGLIQSLSSTITTDIIRPLFGGYLPKEEQARAKREVWINRVVIGVIGIFAIVISANELFNPAKFSVAVLAQNGVYAYFAAAFVPILFGTFLKDVPKFVPLVASLTAIFVHLGIYFGEWIHYMKAPVKNPGIAAACAVLSSLLVGAICLFVSRSLSQTTLTTQNEQQSAP